MAEKSKQYVLFNSYNGEFYNEIFSSMKHVEEFIREELINDGNMDIEEAEDSLEAFVLGPQKNLSITATVVVKGEE